MIQKISIKLKVTLMGILLAFMSSALVAHGATPNELNKEELRKSGLSLLINTDLEKLSLLFEKGLTLDIFNEDTVLLCELLRDIDFNKFNFLLKKGLTLDALIDDVDRFSELLDLFKDTDREKFNFLSEQNVCKLSKLLKSVWLYFKSMTPDKEEL